MKKTTKYETIKELAKAYADGEIPQDCPLTLDNDCAFVYVPNPEDEDDSICVYRSSEPPDCEILHEALTLLGIPHEGA